METGIRVLLLTAVLMTLPGCASVRNWFHHRSEVRQAKAEAKEEAAQQDAQAAAQDADATPPRVVDPEVERRKIEQALKDAGGNRARAADVLQVGFKAFTAKLREYGLDATS